MGDKTGLLTTKAVYRLFGPKVTGSITGAIPTINGISKLGSTLETEVTSNTYASGVSFTHYLDYTNMYTNPTNNTFKHSGSSETSTNFGTSFGAGITITSFFYNIFESSTLSWQIPPANTATTCTIFGYIYNEIQSVGSNAFRHKKPVYVAFCPIDATFNMSSASSASNIIFLNPNYPLTFTTGFNFKSFLALAYSDQFGYLKGFRK